MGNETGIWPLTKISPDDIKNEHIDFVFGDDRLINLMSTEYSEKFERFFWGKNIVGMTAVVGKNGSGKTILLEKIADFAKTELQNEAMVLFLDEHEVILKHSSKGIVYKNNSVSEVGRFLSLYSDKNGMEVFFSERKLDFLKENLKYRVSMDEESRTWDSTKSRLLKNIDKKNEKFDSEFEYFHLEKCLLDNLWGNAEAFRVEDYNSHFKNKEFKIVEEKKMDGQEKISLENSIETNSTFVKVTSKVRLAEVYSGVIKIGEEFEYIADALSLIIPIYIDIDNVSRGEFALISSFLKIQNYVEECKEKRVLLLLDEIDARFHPDWSRVYISGLLSFLKTIGKEEKDFQVILTTHSPFILSDFPNGHTLFLSESAQDDKFIVVVENKEDKKYFSGELYDLLKDNFFWDSDRKKSGNKYVGTHSQEVLLKIRKTLATYISEDKDSEFIEQKEEIEKVVDSIADFLIDDQFQTLLRIAKNVDGEINNDDNEEQTDEGSNELFVREYNRDKQVEKKRLSHSEMLLTDGGKE